MLEEYCREQGIDAELIDTPASAKTADDAARALNTTPEHIIKSIVCIADEKPVLVIVRGQDRIDLPAVAAAVDADDARLTSPEEVEDITGYAVGAVPPVGTGLRTLIDEHVLQYDEVYGGGGAEDRLIALDPRFIVGEHDLVVDLKE